jgi:hypothetical protein
VFKEIFQFLSHLVNRLLTYTEKQKKVNGENLLKNKAFCLWLAGLITAGNDCRFKNEIFSVRDYTDRAV